MCQPYMYCLELCSIAFVTAAQLDKSGKLGAPILQNALLSFFNALRILLGLIH